MKRMLSAITLILLISITACCLSSLTYISLREIDRKRCYERMAQDLGVSPTYVAISGSINSRVQSLLIPGMSQSDVLTALEGIAPVSVTREDPTLDGGLAELTILRFCSFYENNIRFYIYYSEGGKLEEGRLSLDD